jgi:hypothetical protein
MDATLLVVVVFTVKELVDIKSMKVGKKFKFKRGCVWRRRRGVEGCRGV